MAPRPYGMPGGCMSVVGRQAGLAGVGWQATEQRMHLSPRRQQRLQVAPSCTGSALCLRASDSLPAFCPSRRPRCYLPSPGTCSHYRLFCCSSFGSLLLPSFYPAAAPAAPTHYHEPAPRAWKCYPTTLQECLYKNRGRRTDRKAGTRTTCHCLELGQGQCLVVGQEEPHVPATMLVPPLCGLLPGTGP